MACPHLNHLSLLKQPRLSQQVHREECTQCFDNQVRDRADTERAIVLTPDVFRAGSRERGGRLPYVLQWWMFRIGSAPC